MSKLSTWLDRRKARNRDAFPKLHWGPALFVTLNLVALAFLVFDGPAAGSAALISPAVRHVGDFLTDFGKSGWILLAAFLLFFQALAGAKTAVRIRERMRALAVAQLGAYLFLTTALSGITANLMKRLIGRARPVNFDEWGISGFSPLNGSRFESFPSGHSTTVGAFFMALILLMPRHRIPLAMLAVWFGMTRVIVGAHYPSDVIAGLAYGAWFSFLTAVVFSRYQLVFRLDAEGFPVLRRELFPLLRNSS